MKSITKVEAKQLDLFAPVEAHAQCIDKARLGIVKNVLLIGAELSKAHDKLAHHGNGVFGRWVEERCGISRMSANRYMQVQEAFGKTKECNKLLQTFDDSAMYLLAAPSAPKQALDDALGRAKSGEKITHKIAKEIVAEFKPEPKDRDDTFVIHPELDRWTDSIEKKLTRIPDRCKVQFIGLLITHLRSIQDDAAQNDTA